MTRRSLAPSLCFALLLLAAGSAHAAVQISATGSWQIDVDPFSAGFTGTPVYESPLEALQLTVIGTGGRLWRVTAAVDAASLPPGARLFIRRTSHGSGNGTVTGGEAYVEITNATQLLCAGSGTRHWMGVQFRLIVDPAQVDPGTYTVVVTYTTEESP